MRLLFFNGNKELWDFNCSLTKWVIALWWEKVWEGIQSSWRKPATANLVSWEEALCQGLSLVTSFVTTTLLGALSVELLAELTVI